MFSSRRESNKELEMRTESNAKPVRAREGPNGSVRSGRLTGSSLASRSTSMLRVSLEDLCARRASIGHKISKEREKRER